MSKIKNTHSFDGSSNVSMGDKKKYVSSPLSTPPNDNKLPSNIGRTNCIYVNAPKLNTPVYDSEDLFPSQPPILQPLLSPKKEIKEEVDSYLDFMSNNDKHLYESSKKKKKKNKYTDNEMSVIESWFEDSQTKLSQHLFELGELEDDLKISCNESSNDKEQKKRKKSGSSKERSKKIAPELDSDCQNEPRIDQGQTKVSNNEENQVNTKSIYGKVKIKHSKSLKINKDCSLNSLSGDEFVSKKNLEISANSLNDSINSKSSNEKKQKKRKMSDSSSKDQAKKIAIYSDFHSQSDHSVDKKQAKGLNNKEKQVNTKKIDEKVKNKLSKSLEINKDCNLNSLSGEKFVSKNNLEFSANSLNDSINSKTSHEKKQKKRKKSDSSSKDQAKKIATDSDSDFQSDQRIDKKQAKVCYNEENQVNTKKIYEKVKNKLSKSLEINKDCSLNSLSGEEFVSKNNLEFSANNLNDSINSKTSNEKKQMKRKKSDSSSKDKFKRIAIYSDSDSQSDHSVDKKQAKVSNNEENQVNTKKIYGKVKNKHSKSLEINKDCSLNSLSDEEFLSKDNLEFLANSLKDSINSKTSNEKKQKKRKKSDSSSKDKFKRIASYSDSDSQSDHSVDKKQAKVSNNEENQVNTKKIYGKVKNKHSKSLEINKDCNLNSLSDEEFASKTKTESSVNSLEDSIKSKTKTRLDFSTEKKPKSNILYENVKFLLDKETIERESCLNEIISKYKKITVLLPKPVAPLHHIETRVSTYPTAAQLLEMESLGVEIKKGNFIKAEDDQIKANFTEFCTIHDLPLDPVPFIEFKSVATKIMSLEDRIKFVRFLAYDLPQRPLHCVYKRFQRIYDTQKKNGTFSEEEDDIILNYLTNTKESKPFRSLSKILKRPPLQIEKRAIYLKNNNKFKCNEENITELLNNLLKVTKCHTIDELKDRKISPRQWKKIKKIYHVHTTARLQQAWYCTIYPRIFSEWDNTKDSRAELVNVLHKKGYPDWRDIKWNEVAEELDGYNSRACCSLFNSLVITCVPKSCRTTLPNAIEYLFKHKSLFQDRSLKRISILYE